MKKSGDSHKTPFVFLDPGGRRWPRLRRVLVGAGIMVFLGVVLFVQALFVPPDLRLPASVRKIKGQLKALQQQNPAAQNPKADAAWQKFYTQTQAAQQRLAKVREQLHPKPRRFNEIRLGFYTDWDPNSYNSLDLHAAQLTHVCPEWMSLADGTGAMRIEPDERVVRLAAAKGVVLMPL